MSPDHLLLLGYVAAALTVASFVPQAIRAWRTRRTADLSLGMFALLFTSAAMWVAYGILRRDWPVIVTNVSTFVLITAILVAKLRYK